MVLYESPHKIIKTLGQIVEFCEVNRPVALCREISKKFEECIRGSASEVLAQVEERGGVKRNGPYHRRTDQTTSKGKGLIQYDFHQSTIYRAMVRYHDSGPY